MGHGKARFAVALLGSCAGCLGALPAYAQSTASAPSAGIEDIVVTAQRRTERLQDVPIAITVANGEALETAHVLDVGNIRALSPSVTFVTSYNPASSSNIQIRGIGTVGASRAFEGAVGVFIDGVYRTRPGQALGNFLDVDNLQILRGPQGTLFGKNTSAGALLLTSAAPNFKALSLTYEASYGNYDDSLFRGALNVPFSETIALRVAGVISDRDGYIHDPNNGRDYNDHHAKAVKAQIAWKPTDQLTFRVIGDYARERQNCCFATVDAFNGPTQPLIDALGTAIGLRPPSRKFSDYQQSLSSNPDQIIVDQGVVLQSDFAFDNGSAIHAVTAYRDWSFDQRDADGDATAAPIASYNETFHSKVFSQELTYTGRIDHLPLFRGAKFVVGGYYAHEKISATRDIFWDSGAQTYWDTLLSFGGVPPGTAFAGPGRFISESLPASSRSLAAFTHWTFAVSNRLDVIAGLRYSSERKHGALTNTFFRGRPNEISLLIGAFPGPDYDAHHSDGEFSGTFGFQYRLSPGAMTYATYSRGFKSGGVNLDGNAAGGVSQNPRYTPGAVPLDPTYKPEFIDGYEAGLKLDYLGGRARTNMAIFYNKLHDLQVAQFLGLQFAIFNAPSAEVYGAELESAFRVTREFTLNASATVLPKAKFGGDPISGILAGRRFAQAPKFAGNASVDWNHPITEKLAFTARAALQYQSKIFDNTAGNEVQTGYGLLNLGIGLKALSDRWVVEGYCLNCTDKRYAVQHIQTPLQAGDVNAYVGAPRTYGVRLRGKF